MNFGFLRNAIAHGEEIKEHRYTFGRNAHFWLAEYRLRAAIRETVALAGYPYVRFSPSVRELVKQDSDLQALFGLPK